jgi:hypothetical protein
MCLIAYRGSYEMMFRSIKRQRQDTELGTGSRTNRHKYTYVRVQWGYNMLISNRSIMYTSISSVILKTFLDCSAFDISNEVIVGMLVQCFHLCIIFMLRRNLTLTIWSSGSHHWNCFVHFRTQIRLSTPKICSHSDATYYTDKMHQLGKKLLKENWPAVNVRHGVLNKQTFWDIF